jgi:transcription elongation GreA/GreB family factor
MALDKAELKAELVARLRADLETLERAHKATVEGATSEEAKPENDKDTRATEASYLARGQAARVEDLRAGYGAAVALAVGEPKGGRVAVGALVIVEEDGAEEALFVAPAGGGTKLAGGTVRVLTPEAPLGRALLGKEAGDEVDVVLGGKTRSLAIVRVL